MGSDAAKVDADTVDAAVVEDDAALADEPELSSCCSAISASKVSLVSDAVGEPVRPLFGGGPSGIAGAIAMVIVVAVVLDEEDDVAESCDSSEDSNWLAGLAETDVMAISKRIR